MVGFVGSLVGRLRIMRLRVVEKEERIEEKVRKGRKRGKGRKRQENKERERRRGR